MRFIEGERTRYRIRLERRAEASRLTHLAQIESIRRAVSASGLPAVLDGKRKKPRPRVAFGPAIALGYESLAEYFDVELLGRSTVEEVARKMSGALSSGFSVRSIRRIPKFFPSLDSSVSVVRYGLEAGFPADADRRLQEFLSRESVVIEKVKEGGARIERIEARPLIIEMVLESPSRIVLTVRFGPKKTVKPEALVKEWLGALPENLKILREELFSETKAGELIQP